MSLLTSYTGKDNFWESNPQLKLNLTLKDFYDKDKSKKKEESSKIMYALSFYIDVSPDNKAYGHIPPDDRKNIIAKEFLNDPKFDWDKYNNIIDVLQDMCLTPAQKSLFNFYQLMVKRDAFIKQTPYNLATCKDLDNVVKNTAAFWKSYEDLQKKLSMETDTKQKGGKNLTLSDKGAI